MVKVTESGMNRSSSVGSTLMQNLTLITFIVSEGIAMFKAFVNSTSLVSVGCERLAKGKGHETD